MIAIFDIDGVLADARHREHHVQSRPRDWDSFFGAVGADTPIEEGIRQLTEARADHEIVLVSGRPESARQATVEWLGRHGVGFDRLVLRAEGDHRPAPVLKAQLVGGIAPPDQVAMVVDDDGGVVDRLVAKGYPAVRFSVLG